MGTHVDNNKLKAKMKGELHAQAWVAYRVNANLLAAVCALHVANCRL